MGDFAAYLTQREGARWAGNLKGGEMMTEGQMIAVGAIAVVTAVTFFVHLLFMHDLD